MESKISPSPYSLSFEASPANIFNMFAPPLVPPAKLPFIHLRTGDVTLAKENGIPEESFDSMDFQHFLRNPLQEIKESIAEMHSEFSSSKIKPSDVFLPGNGDMAISMIIRSFLNKGDNILVPRPGYWMAAMEAIAVGAEVRFYDLEHRNEWEPSIEQMESLIDTKTKLVYFINPGNPACVSLPRSAIEKVVRLAEKKGVAIYSDEIYFNLAYPQPDGEPGQFTSIAQIDSKTPRIIMSGLSKAFQVPGWGSDWNIIIDNEGTIPKEVARRMEEWLAVYGVPPMPSLSNTKNIREKTPEKFQFQFMQTIEKNAKTCSRILEGTKGVEMTKQSGGLFMSLFLKLGDFKDIESDLDFVNKLLHEENVSVYHSAPLNKPGYLRIALFVSNESLEEGCRRINEFIQRHLI